MQLPQIITDVAFGAGLKDPNPVYTDVSGDVLPGMDNRRGRSSETEESQPGFGNVRLRNAGGRYDPANLASPHSPNVVPLVRIRQRAIAPGTSTPVPFLAGLAKDWPQRWTKHGRYGEVTVPIGDGLKALADFKFGIDYTALVLSDTPQHYWQFDETNASHLDTSPIVQSGSFTLTSGSTKNDRQTTGLAATPVGVSRRITGNAAAFAWATPTGGASAIYAPLNNFSAITQADVPASIEFWWRPASIPTDDSFVLLVGKTTNTGLHPRTNVADLALMAEFLPGGAVYRLKVGQSNGGTTQIDFSTTVANGPVAGRTDYVVIDLDDLGTTLNAQLYINNVLVGSGSTVNPVGLGTAGAAHEFGSAVTAPVTYTHDYDELAVYWRILTADERAEHLRVGQAFGLAALPVQTASARITSVLDAAGWPATLRALDSGGVQLQATGSLTGRTALDLVLQAASAELGQAFADAAGRVVFHNRARRDTATAPVYIFGDGAGELGYQNDILLEFSDKRIVNTVMLTQEGGITYSARDQPSIDRYGERSPAAGSSTLPYADPVDLATAADRIVARGKDPHQRCDQLTLEPSSQPALWPAVLGLELGTLIEIRRRPPDAPQIVLQCFVESIEHRIDVNVWRTTLQLSPKL